jgi:hypothetical protein
MAEEQKEGEQVNIEDIKKKIFKKIDENNLLMNEGIKLLIKNEINFNYACRYFGIARNEENYNYYTELQAKMMEKK